MAWMSRRLISRTAHRGGKRHELLIAAVNAIAAEAERSRAKMIELALRRFVEERAPERCVRRRLHAPLKMAAAVRALLEAK
jgi:hypothetical protein